MAPIRMTARQARELSRHLEGATDAGGRHKSATKAPRTGKRKVTMCAICGNMIYQSPNSGRSSGWTRNWGWTDKVPVDEMAPHHNDCYLKRTKAMREGEYPA